jgi:hypothetical protein
VQLLDQPSGNEAFNFDKASVDQGACQSINFKLLCFWLRTETFAFSRRISSAIKVEKQPMKPIKSNPNEEKCPACNGTGFPAVKQPVPGRRIYPPPCKTCGGKGRMTEAAE